jgi:hypothetical protein
LNRTNGRSRMKYNNCKCCFLRVEDLDDCDVNCQLASFFVVILYVEWIFTELLNNFLPATFHPEANRRSQQTKFPGDDGRQSNFYFTSNVVQIRQCRSSRRGGVVWSV